jgi:hypothetical protein
MPTIAGEYIFLIPKSILNYFLYSNNMEDKWLRTYINETPVVEINGYQMKIEDIVASCLFGGLNLLLVSERGEGKTQILYDVLYGVFGGNGTYIRASPDMEIKDIYTALNLEKLKKKEGTTEDIVKIVERAKNPFTAIDELNRAPPIVQNQLLNILDGYIEVRGKRYDLGVDIDGEKYHMGIATVNLGNHRYLGTFEIDAAILDRFGVVLNLDHYSPSVGDLIEILFSEKPKINIPETYDRSKEIFEGYIKVKERGLPIEAVILLLYLREGVDYISSEPYSQRKTGGILPEGVHESGDIQRLMRPISIRAMKNFSQLYKSLTYVAELNGYPSEEDYYFENALEVLKLTLPYSGSLKRERVDSRYYGNPVLATNDIIKELRKKFEVIKDRIFLSLQKKKEGKLSKDDLDYFDNEWRFLIELLKRVEI